MPESAVAAAAAASGDKSCGVESQRADATQGSSVVNDTPNHLHIGEFVKRKMNLLSMILQTVGKLAYR